MKILLLTDEVARKFTGYSKTAIERKFERGQIPDNDTILIKRWSKWHIDVDEWYKFLAMDA